MLDQFMRTFRRGNKSWIILTLFKILRILWQNAFLRET